MKLTAAKFALCVFVLLALGMLVTAAPQSTDATDGTGTSSPIGGTGDSTTTPDTGKTGGDTSTGSKTGTEPDTGSGSTTKTPAKSGNDEQPSDSSSKSSGGTKTTPDVPTNGADSSSGNDATPKTSQGSSNAKNNDDGNGNNRNSGNNSNNGNTRNGKDSGKDRNNNNDNSANSNNNAKGATNADTTGDANQNQGTDNTASHDPVAQETAAEPSSTPDAAKLAVNQTCTSNDVCESGLCQDGKCAEKKEDDDKTGKTLGMALGIIVAVMCIGMVLLTGVRMMLKRRRSDYYSKRISEIAAPSRATTPSFYHDSSSLVLEKQARNGNYAFKSPDAAISSDSVRPPAQGYYGAADGYDMDQSYTRTGMPNYTNDQHLYAPNAPANDWAVTPTYGAFPTTAAPDANPIPVPQPTMLPVPAMSPIPRNVQPAANDPNAFGNLHSGGAGERDSELIMYGGAASQDLTRESMYDASDDQQNDGGRYKMNSIYSAYGRDSLYADTKDTPSVPDVPDLPLQYQK